MADEQNPESRPTPLGIYDKPQSGGISGIEIVALLMSVVWLGGAALVYFSFPQEIAQTSSSRLYSLMGLLAVFMPVALIWVAATTARTSQVMREESRRLQLSIDAIRQAYIAQSRSRPIDADVSVTRKLEEIATAARKTETTLAMFTTARTEQPPAQRVAPAQQSSAQIDEQPSLALGTEADTAAPPLSKEDFVRALNFPETAEDLDGFAALRRALQDRSSSQLITASQDILTLLSQEGIYMDDLRPDRARPEIWRAFAQGTRGRAVAALGGIRDRSSLALTSGRMKQDPIFRDAAHHFLRRFDQAFSAFEPEATDSEINAVADTRTARAFMLLGRIAGTFD